MTRMATSILLKHPCRALLSSCYAVPRRSFTTVSRQNHVSSHYFYASSVSSFVSTARRRRLRVPQQPWRRSLATSNNNSSSSSSSNSSSSFLHHPLQQIVLWRQKPFKEKIGHYLRLVRLPVVAYGIYTLGFQQGVITSHQNPLRFQQELVDAVLVAHVPAGTQRDDIDVVVLSENDLTKNNARKDAYHQVATVAQQLIQQARIHVEKEYLQAIEVAQRRIMQQQNSRNNHLTAQQLIDQVHRDAKVKFWHEAQQRITGSSNALDVHDPWKFLFVGGAASPNAWVSEMLPKKIFITKSMVSTCMIRGMFE